MFEDLPLDLQNDIHAAMSNYPDTRQSFEKLYSHFTDQLPHKKIRPTTIVNDQVDLSSGTVIRDLSFSIPDRKKFNLVISSGSLSIVKDNVVVHTIRNNNVSGCLLLEIPDKLKKQYSVVIVDKTKQGEYQAFCQFTLTDIEADNKTVAIPHGKQRKGKIVDVLVSTLKSLDITIVHSNSLVVAAHRGSKEGQLYFLSDMIFFGFKKPLLIFRCYEIESISYSSITRLTFNLSIKLFNSAQEYEFSMIDQTNFDRINEYATRYELNNQSMAESRRAKLYTKEQSANELQKAQEELPEELPEEAAEQGNGQINNNDSDDEEDVNYEDSEDEDDSEPSSEEEGQDADEGDEEDEENEDEENDEEEDI